MQFASRRQVRTASRTLLNGRGSGELGPSRNSDKTIRMSRIRVLGGRAFRTPEAWLVAPELIGRMGNTRISYSCPKGNVYIGCCTLRKHPLFHVVTPPNPSPKISPWQLYLPWQWNSRY